MTEEEFRKIIKHKIEKRQFSTDVISDICFHILTPVNQIIGLGTQEEKEVLNEVIKHNEERLFRRVYEDRRQEFYDAIDELYLKHPMDISGFQGQIDKIMKLAKRQ